MLASSAGAAVRKVRWVVRRFFGLACLGETLPLVVQDDAVQLVSKSALLGFGGDVPFGSGRPAVGAGGDGAVDRSGGLFRGSLDDLVGAPPCVWFRDHPDASALAVQPPVGREGNHYPAGWAVNRAREKIRPNVSFRAHDSIFFEFRRGISRSSVPSSPVRSLQDRRLPEAR